MDKLKQLWEKLMALSTRNKRGPKYTVRDVDRQTFNQFNVGDEYDGRTVVEGFYDAQENAYLLVTREKAAAAGAGIT